jgi:hypothetical protein
MDAMTQTAYASPKTTGTGRHRANRRVIAPSPTRNVNPAPRPGDRLDGGPTVTYVELRVWFRHPDGETGSRQYNHTKLVDEAAGPISTSGRIWNALAMNGR